MIVLIVLGVLAVLAAIVAIPIAVSKCGNCNMRCSFIYFCSNCIYLCISLSLNLFLLRRSKARSDAFDGSSQPQVKEKYCLLLYIQSKPPQTVSFKKKLNIMYHASFTYITSCAVLLFSQRHPTTRHLFWQNLQLKIPKKALLSSVCCWFLYNVNSGGKLWFF